MEKESDSVNTAKPSLKTILLFVSYLIIALSFYYLLAHNVPNQFSFGFFQVVFAVIGALAFTAAFVWIEVFMYTNRYLGLVIGLLLNGAMVYALYLEFEGPKTLFFALAGTIVTLIYLGICFVQVKKKV